MTKGFPLRFLEDNSEAVNYTEADMPIRSVISHQEDYPTLSVVNHWHNDLEFSYVIKGHMMYSVNGETAELNEGDMIFVNSARLHYGYWDKIEECEFLCVLFGIEILSAVPDKLIQTIVRLRIHYVMLNLDHLTLFCTNQGCCMVAVTEFVL